MVDAVETLRQAAANVEPQHLCLHVRPHDFLALVAPERGRVDAHLPFELLHGLRVARHVPELTRFAFVAHDRHREPPPFTGLADHVRGRNTRAVEQHLPELVRDAVDHAQRPLLDAGLVHRDRERGESLVLRHVGVGPREEQAPIGHVGVARPDLVAVDHVLVAVARRGRAQRREVGAGIGLAEALAPTFAPADQSGKVALLDRVAPVRRDALHEIAEARTRRRARGRDLFVEDDVEHRRQVVTAEARRPAQPEEARVEERGVPLGLARPVLVVGRRRRQAGIVLREPRPKARPELGLGG